MHKLNNLCEVFQVMSSTNHFGKSQKQIACEIRPDLINPRADNPTKQVESWLNRCLNPFGDRYFRPDELSRFIEACGNAEILINFLCEKYGFESPVRKVVLSPEKELKVLRQILDEKKIKVDVGKYVETHRNVLGLDVANDRIWERIRRLLKL